MVFDYILTEDKVKDSVLKRNEKFSHSVAPARHTCWDNPPSLAPPLAALCTGPFGATQDFPFRIFLSLLLIRTASLTCLERQSLVLAVTLAVKTGSCPPCLLS